MSLYSDAKYNISVMGIFAVTGLFIKVFLAQSTSSDGSSGPANAVIWGYGLISAALFCVMFVQFALNNKSHLIERIGSTTSVSKFVSGLVSQVLPVTMILMILAWTIALNFMYSKQINKGDITPVYSNLSRVSSYLILFQVGIAFKIAVDKLNPMRSAETKSFDMELSALSYLLTALNLMLLGIMNINLVFFSTDG